MYPNDLHNLLVEKAVGFIQLGGARMALLDIEAGFWGIRRQMEALVGTHLTNSVLQQAGANGGASFARSFKRQSGIEQSAMFSACVQAYQAAGFGQFEINTLEWPLGHIQICATDAFEAWMYLQQKEKPDTPICAYTAGVFVGFVNILGERQDVVCIEHTCQAQGDEACFFELLPASQAKGKTVVPYIPDPGLGRQLNLLEILFERMPMGIAVFDREYRIQRYNPTWQEFSQRYAPPTAAPLVPGVGYFDHLPGSEPIVMPLFEEVLAGETIRQDALRFESGGIVSYWDVVLAPLMKNGEASGILNVTIDVTEYVILQQNLEQRVEERTNEIRSLLQVSQDINSTLELKALLEQVLDQLKTVVDYTGASILTLDEGELIVRAYCGPIPEKNARQLHFPLDKALVNREVIQQQQPLIIADIRDDTALARMFRQTAGDELESTFQYVRSWLGVPLMVKGVMLGMLTLDHNQPDHFASRHADLVQSFANQVGVAIENARLYQVEQEQHKESERRRQVAESLRDIMAVLNSDRSPQEIFEYITRRSGNLLSADASILYSVNGAKLTYEAEYNLPEALSNLKPEEIYPGEANRKLLNQEPVIISDARSYLNELLVQADLNEIQRRWYTTIRENFQSYFGIPLIVRNQIFGGLIIYFKDQRTFTEEDIHLGLTLGEQAALAIENTRLHLEEQDRQRELQILLDVASAANSSLDLDEMLNQTLDLVVNLIGASRAGVVLQDDTGELKLHILRPERTLESQDLEKILHTGQAVITSGEMLYIPPDAALGLNEPGALLPLQTRGQIFGVLGIIGPQGGTFNSVQLTLFKSIADQLGVAIENARLFEKAEEAAIATERNRLARDLHDAVTQTLFSSSMIADVLPKIWERNPEEGHRRLEELRQLTRGALSEMRTLLVELRPAALVDTDLGDLIGHQVNAFVARTRLTVEFDRNCVQNPPPDVKEMFYRISQEAFNNIAKHADASTVTVGLDCQPGKTELVIQDNGVGFDLDTATTDGLGLGIMAERARNLGAQLEIYSQVREGTRLRILWQDPNNKKDKND